MEFVDPAEKLRGLAGGMPAPGGRILLFRRAMESAANDPRLDDADRLLEFLDAHRRLMVLTGAGVSTDSGIPDYRDAAGSWKVRRPIQFREFVGSDAVRQRYWARSFVGWRRIEQARPNATHGAIARLEAAGRVDLLVTQNVDSLHQRSGSRAVVDLHGRLDAVECLGCRVRFGRTAFQEELERLNPGWFGAVGAGPEEAVGVVAERPDGDVELGDVDYSAFRVPTCPHCAGVLKPAVVFFGEQVPRERVARAMGCLETSDGLLVVGSSLMVWSGYRFVRRAAELGRPVAIVNLGKTRGDGEATLKIESPCGELLPRVVERLGVGPQPTD